MRRIGTATISEPGTPGGPSSAGQPTTGFASDAAEKRVGLGGAGGRPGIGGVGARGVERARE